MKSLTRTTGIILSTIVLFGFILAFTPIQQKPWEVPAKYKTMKSTVPTSAASVATGKTLYNQHCKSCHGTTGKGDGPKALNLKTTIRSLASKEYKGQTMGEKYYKSYIGRDEMPNFEKKVVDEEDRWSIINYMETLK